MPVSKKDFMFSIDKIPEEGVFIEETLSPHMFDGQKDVTGIFRDDVFVTVHLQVLNNTVTAAGSMQTKVRLICSRCTKQFTKPLKILDVFYQKEFSHNDEVINLTPEIREDIIIALPIKALCRDSCKGLCVRCGQDLNKRKCNCEVASNSTWHMQLDKIKIVKNEK